MHAWSEVAHLNRSQGDGYTEGRFVSSTELIQAREDLLRAAHRVMAGRIDDTDPNMYDDAEMEYSDEMLEAAAAKLARAKIKHRLEEGGGVSAPSSVVEAKLTKIAERSSDDAGAWMGPSAALKGVLPEVAVMELALLEIAHNTEEVDREEAGQIAFDALPEGAGRA